MPDVVVTSSSERKALVAPLIEAVVRALPHFATGDIDLDDAVVNKNRQCLVDISISCLDAVLTPIVETLTVTVKDLQKEAKQQQSRPASQAGSHGLSKLARLEKTILVLLHITSDCLTLQWDKQGAEAPALPANLVQCAVTQAFEVITLFQDQAAEDRTDELSDAAGRVVFKLTARNFNPAFDLIATKLRELTAVQDDVPDVGILQLLKHMHFNRERLHVLIEACNVAITSLKKGAQLALAPLIRSAIWRWIEVYPTQFVELQRDGKRLSASCDSLFDFYANLSEKSTRKALTWPVQTSILLLCPDIMLGIHSGGKEANMASKGKLLDGMKKALLTSNKSLSDVATRCYVDICKASTFVSKKTTTSCLRFMVPPIEAELKTRLLDPCSPAYEIIGPEEEELLVSFLIACFRLNENSVISGFMVPFINNTVTPPVYKSIVIESLLHIKAEPTLEWNAGIESTYQLLSRPLRKMLHSVMKKIRAQPLVSAQPVSKTTKKKETGKATSDLSPEVQLLRWILCLLQTDPTFAFYHHNNEPDADPGNKDWYGEEACDHTAVDMRMVMTSLVECLEDSRLEVLAGDAVATLVTLYDQDIIAQWSPDNLMPSFWDISSQVFIRLAMKLVAHKSSNPKQILACVKQLLIRTNDFVRAHKMDAMKGCASELHKQTRSKLDAVLLTSLCHRDAEVVLLAAECFKLLCEQADTLLEAAEADPSYDPSEVMFLQGNEHVYRQLWDSGQLRTGYRAAQKRILSVIRETDVQTAGNLAAWRQMHSQWQILVDSLLLQPVDPTSTTPLEMPAEFVSTTCMLCALSGVCLMSDLSALKFHRVKGNSQADLDATVHEAKQFLARMLQLLVCDTANIGVSIRETVKEAIGSELTPKMYPLLFAAFNETVEDQMFKSSNLVVSPQNTLFLNQVTNTMRLLLNSKISTAAENLALVDFEHIVETFVDYLRQLRRVDEQIKIDFCNLISLMMAKKQWLSFRHEMQFRNSLVGKLMEFMSTLDQKNIGEHIDLDTACMKAIASLLGGLPLQPVNDDEVDALVAKSKLFLKYFTFFMNVTNRCQTSTARAGPNNQSDPEEGGAEATSEAASSAHSSPPTRPRSTEQVKGLVRADTNRSLVAPPRRSYQMQRLLRNIASLRDTCCQAMSNLLSANVDVGLGHSISMGYHSDVGMRHAFTEVLTEVLKQGTEFDTLAETVLSDRYSKLVELVVSPDLRVVKALATSVSSQQLDTLSHLLFSLFDAHAALIPFLVRMAEWEVAQCLSEQTLFRRNSLATKVGISFVKQHQQTLLADVLQPALLRMADDADASYEIDPARVKSEDAREANQKRLLDVTARMMEDILASAARMPAKIKNLCYIIRTVTEVRFPEAALSAVGGFIFLRYLSPAIVSPEAYGLVDHLSPAARRGLLLISKIIQAIANMTPFSGVKESFMEVANPFVTETMPRLKSFLAAISADVALDPSAVPACRHFGVDLPGISFDAPSEAQELEYEVNSTDVGSLHRLLYEHREKIGRELTLTSSKSVSDTPELYDELAMLLAQLGEPPKAESTARRGTVTASRDRADSKFEDFLELHEMRKTSTEAIKSRNVFFQNGKSKAGRPVFYYIARRYLLSEVEAEQAILFILRTLKPFLRAPFDLVIDMTLGNHNHEPALTTLERFSSLLPSEAMQNLANVYVYNPSSFTRGFFKRAQRLIVTGKLHKKIVFTDLPELKEHIPELALPSSTASLGEHTVEFPNVNRVGDNRKHSPVILRVGPASLQVTSVERVNVLRTTAITNDVFDIAKISGVTLSDEHLVIEYEHGADNVVLASPDLVAIDQAVREVWERHLLSKPASSVRKVLRPADVPGTLLNMALLNLGSPDPALRLAAYNFLAALTVTFDFQIGGELLETTGLALPQNNTHFIVRISEYLAKHEKRLTLEFLEECIAGLEGSTVEQKHLCLEYMQPWLPNVKTFTAGAPEKAMNIIEGLAMVTIREKELYPSLQAKVWYTIGRVDDLVEQAAAHFLSVAIQNGPGSPAAAIMSDAMVTLAAANVRIVSRQVLDKAHAIFAATSESPVSQLDQHPLWKDLQVLVRFILMLSFNNRLDLENNLPDVLHIVSLSLACGSALTRASLHAITINVVQSLCTTLKLDEEKLRFVRLRLSDMMHPKFCLHFGISFKSGQSNPVFSAMRDGEVDTHAVTDQFNMLWLQSVVELTWEILLCCSTPETQWGQRWVSLARDTAFVDNSALQPRAFVTLGVITKQVPEELLLEVLDVLAKSLRALDTVLVESALMCLTKMMRVVPKESSFHTAMFWVACNVLQMGDPSLFPSALGVLEATVHTLDSHGAFAGRGIAKVLMQAREPVAALCDALDAQSAISFKSNFSFAIGATLMKGWSHPSPTTTSRTIRLLMSFLSVEQHAHSVQLSADMLGYAAVLMPVVEESRNSLLAPESDHDAPGVSFSALFQADVMTKDNKLLFLVAVCAMLENVRSQEDKCFVYSLLSQAAESLQAEFPAVSSLLLPHLSAIVQNPPDPQTLQRCQQIIRTLLFSATESQVKLEDLSSVGFAGLPTAVKPTRSEEDLTAMASSVADVLLRFMELGKGSTA